MKTPYWAQLFFNPAKFFVIAALVFGVAFLLINPPGFGLDERAHFMRAYEIANGQFGAVRAGSDRHLGAYLPSNLTQWVATSTTDLLDNNPNTYFLKQHDANPSAYKTFFHEKFSTVKKDDPLSDNQLAGTYNYSPVGYLHMALAVRVGESLGMNFMPIFYLTRAANLILFILLIWWSIRIIPKFKWLIVSVSLLPACLFQASVVTLDSLVIGVTLLLFSYAIKLWYFPEGQKISFWHGIIIICLLTILALTKPPYMIVFLLLLLLPASRFITNKQQYIWKAAWILTPIVIFFAWYLFNSRVSADIVQVQQGAGGIKDQVVNIINHPIRFPVAFLRTFHDGIDVMLGGMTGKIGDRFIGLQNAYLYLLFFLTAGLAAFYFSREEGALENKNENKLFTFALAITAAVAIIVVALSMYVTYTPVGAYKILGLQGRYLIPLLPIVLLFFARIVPANINARRKYVTLFMEGAMVVFLTVTATIYYLVNYY